MTELEQIRACLERHFGYRTFLDGQESVIAALLGGEDAVVIMPTGGGKSLCFQLPAMLMEGVTIVVSPLIALMKDQVDALTERGIPATFINSSLTDTEIAERLAGLGRGDYKLVYVAPERFKSARFTEAAGALPISLFAVDEAHCISQWGHDFRPDYTRLRKALIKLGHPRVAALTATATPEVRDDIVIQLGLGMDGRKEPGLHVHGFSRPNLSLLVNRTQNAKEKYARILHHVRAGKRGIIYCATRKHVERVKQELTRHAVACISYHGGMQDGERSKAQERFMTEANPVVIATNAFGMGIDRPDIRFVVHFDIPGSLEAYYQEAGRAGRDGEPAACELLFNYADVQTQEFFIDGANPTIELIRDLLRALKKLCADGPVEMPISDIAAQVESVKNSMAVGTTLFMLERAGVIERAYLPGSRTYTTRLLKPDASLDSLKIDFERLQAKRERDTQKLKRMIKYVDAHGCRHRYILDYFGDEEAEDRCSHCDNCLAGRSDQVRKPTADERVMVQKALSCVARLDGRFGRGRIAQILFGSKSKEIIDANLDRQSTYGLLQGLGTDGIWQLLDGLVAADCLSISEGKYPVLSITPLGWDVMTGKQDIALRLPTHGTSVRSRPNELAGMEADIDRDLFNLLRDWRRRKAAELGGIPAYRVYSDETLRHLAMRKPDNLHKLETVKGIGPAKIEQFGEETLELILAHEASAAE